MTSPLPQPRAADARAAVRDFEAAWAGGARPRVEDFLGPAAGGDRLALLGALVGRELDLCDRHGLPITSLKDYLARFPGTAEVLAPLFRERAGRTVAPAPPPAPAAHAAHAPGLPASIGRFQVLQLLGAGAFGKVYRARDPQLQREVAVKVPSRGALESDAERARFLAEARAAAGLQHPNICPVYEVGKDGERDYIVMAYVPGKSLAEMLAARPDPLPEKQAALIVRKLALALEAAHARGIVHRDLKPANILFDRDRKDVVITDFGLARGPGSDEAGVTRSGAILGTPAYMSPEQARGEGKRVGPASDVYSLGVVLYELLTRERPFCGGLAVVLAQVLHAEPEPPSRLRPGLDPRLEAVCLQALAKDPAARFPSMRALARALDAYLDQPAPSPAPGPPPPPPGAGDAAGGPVAPPPGGASATAPEVTQGEAPSPTGPGLSDLVAALSADRTAERTALLAESRKGRTLPVALALGGGFTAVLVVVLALLFLAPRGPATVEITLNQWLLLGAELADPSLAFFLDGKPIPAARLSEPAPVGVGPHEVTARRGGEVVRTWRLDVPRRPEVPPAPAEPDAPAGLLQVFRGHVPGGVKDLAVSADGTRVYSAGSGPVQSEVLTWEPGAEAVLHRLPWLNPTRLALPAGGARLVVGVSGHFGLGQGNPTYVSVLSLPDRKELLTTTRMEDVGGFECPLHLTPDGRFLLTTQVTRGGSFFTWVYDLEGRKEWFRVPGGHCVGLSPGGKEFYVGTAGGLELYDLATTSVRRKLTAPRGPIRQVAVSADGTRLATVPQTGFPPRWADPIDLWDASAGTIERTLPGHEGGVTCLTFALAGGRLLSGGSDGVVRLWDPAAGKEEAAFAGHAGPVTSLAFTPGGKRALSGSADGTVRLWQLP